MWQTPRNLKAQALVASLHVRLEQWSRTMEQLASGGMQSTEVLAEEDEWLIGTVSWSGGFS